MEPMQREIKTDRIDVTKVKEIKVVKPKPEGRARPRLGARLLATGLSALLVASALIANDADAKGKKKHAEKTVAAEVDLADLENQNNPLDQYLREKEAEELTAPGEGVGPEPEPEPASEPAPDPSKAPKQSEDEFMTGIYAELQKGKSTGAQVDSAPAPKEDKDGVIVTTNVVFPAAPKRVSEYSDPALDAYPGYTHINGTRRGVMNPESGFDIGGNIIGNEAGVAGFMSARYRGFARMDAGALAWNGLPMLPFARLMLSPNLEIWRIKMGYFGSVGTIDGMPSKLYTSQAAGLGYSQPIGDNFRFRVGGVIGGALSYPAWDDTYFSLSAGISMQIMKVLTIYGVPTFYFAADDPIKTAYVGNYEPRFQNIEMGFQGVAGEYTGRIFWELGLIRDNKYGISDRYGLQFIRTIRAGDKMDVDLWGSVGMTAFSPQLGGRSDFMAMLGANLVVGNKYVNSTNTVSYSHIQDASWEYAETDFPDSDHPGPYAFGHSGDEYYDGPINEMKERILNSGNFQEFLNSYGNGQTTTDGVITAARAMGAILQKAAYANQAQHDLTMGNPFSDEVQRISSADEELIFQYLKGYVGWYEAHGSNAPLPPQLSNGIALCAGIHTIMADFMSSNGIDSVVATVNTRNGMHVIAAGFTGDGTVLLDYGDLYTTPPNTLDQALRFYGQQKGAYTLHSQIFAKNRSDDKFHYIGTMDTSEGRLFRQVMGLDTKDIVLDQFLGIKQRQQ